MNIVFFSSISENTRRFVDKLGLPSRRIPLRRGDPELLVEEPYVLITPTYGGGDLHKAVPKQVIRFLNNPHNRALLQGVISSGNRNFGNAYCFAGTTIAAKCHVPELDRFELLGTAEDVRRIRATLQNLTLQNLTLPSATLPSEHLKGNQVHL